MEISQLKEEEIIKELKEWLKYDTNFTNLPEFESKNLYKLIQGLLDLYNKEKEKNKELQNYMKEYLIPKSTINLIYISKDKIKQKIEELEEIKIKLQKMYPATYALNYEWLEAYYQIKILQKLLEE